MDLKRPQNPLVSRAVALTYGDEEVRGGRSPRVAARGQGQLADAIIAKAKEFDVPIYESRELVAALIGFEVDQHVPPNLYLAIAEVLAWAYRCEAEAQSALPPSPPLQRPDAPGEREV